MLNRETVVWTGPRDAALEKDFSARFFRSIQMAGSSLMVEDEDARWEHYRRCAGGRLSVDTLKQMPEWELLTYLGPPGLYQRYAEWREYMATSHFLQSGEDFMCDLDHHPGTKGCAAGREFPVLLTHGSVCAMNSTGFRLATSVERFASLGFHCHERLCNKWKECALFPVLRSLNLKRTQLAELSGNGMHLHAQAAWMCYVLSYVKRRDWMDNVERSLGAPTSDFEDDVGEPTDEDLPKSPTGDDLEERLGQELDDLLG